MPATTPDATDHPSARRQVTFSGPGWSITLNYDSDDDLTELRQEVEAYFRSRNMGAESE